MIIEVNREKERVSLGLKQTTRNPWDEIDRKFPVGAKVHGKVVNLVPYGAFVELEPGVEGLVHITEMSWTKRITKPSELLKVGQEVDAVVLGIQKEEQKISLGLRQLEPNPWDMVRHNYPIGARVSGKVRNMTTYGAFIELEEGIDGMVHVSDMCWTRKVNHPVRSPEEGRRGRRHRARRRSPAAAHQPRHEAARHRSVVGHRRLLQDRRRRQGTVTKVTSFGAFVELKDGIDGLVHISQISEDRIDKVKDVLKPGQEGHRARHQDRPRRAPPRAVDQGRQLQQRAARRGNGDLRGAEAERGQRHDEPRRHPRRGFQEGRRPRNENRPSRRELRSRPFRAPPGRAGCLRAAQAGPAHPGAGSPRAAQAQRRDVVG